MKMLFSLILFFYPVSEVFSSDFITNEKVLPYEVIEYNENLTNIVPLNQFYNLCFSNNLFGENESCEREFNKGGELNMKIEQFKTPFVRVDIRDLEGNLLKIIKRIRISKYRYLKHYYSDKRIDLQNLNNSYKYFKSSGLLKSGNKNLIYSEFNNRNLIYINEELVVGFEGGRSNIKSYFIFGKERNHKKDFSGEENIEIYKNNSFNLNIGLEEIKDFGYDLESDSSLYKYVDRYKSLKVKNYIPNIVNYKNIKIDPRVKEDLNNLYENAQRDGITLIFNSGYRSYEEQLSVYQNRNYIYGVNQKLAAPPGHSEHQLGLSVDFSIGNKEYNWLINNAYKYGFIQSYFKENSFSGYNIENWHWRYVGRKLSDYLYNNNLEFSEYYYGKKRN